jgi:CysZ protein
MGLIEGVRYNLRGLQLGLRTPKLLMLGLLRFMAVLIVAVFAAGAVLVYHQEVMALLWTRPASPWIVWLWYLADGLLALLLLGVATILGYILSQVLFSVVIMDAMSRITERITVGSEAPPPSMPFFRHLLYLVRQEIPRALLPVVLSLAVMALGWLTPLGPFLTLVSPLIVAAFLAWDYTDLLPARRMVAFNARWRRFRSSLAFHVGFGLLFLVPLANLVFLSFAPVGATLYHLEAVKAEAGAAAPAE